MSTVIGIRREDKNPWEGRVPLTPGQVRELRTAHALDFRLQPSTIRAFEDGAYRSEGAEVDEDLSACPVVFGIKEMPAEFFQPGKTYMFFSHTIKGQPYNMAMLRRLMELGCQLIDYERVVDDAGRRLIFFGRYAGLAGMIDSLWALGARLAWEGIESPFKAIKQALHYKDLGEVKEALSAIGDRIRGDGLAPELRPFVCGFTGYGNVSLGAQEIYDLLPVEEIEPAELGSDRLKAVSDRLFKVVFKEEQMVEPAEAGGTFALQDYYDHPEKYRSVFERYVPHLSMIMNCIYWDQRYPRFVPKSLLRDLYGGEKQPALRVIGDVTCDVDGAMECTVKATESGAPIFVYDPVTEEAIDGHEGRGPVVLAVDNLPCELAGESSAYFGNVLKPFVPAIAGADYTKPFEACALPAAIKGAMIVYQGELTPDYAYIKQYLMPK